jgi:uncharacterized membrane protein
MSPFLVAACYGSAALLSLYLLWHFGVQHWYLHAISIMAAFALGLVRLPDPFNQPGFTLVIGWFFTALFVWGVAAPVVAVIHHSPDMHLKHH